MTFRASIDSGPIILRYSHIQETHVGNSAAMSSCYDPMWTDNRTSTSDSDFDDKRPRFSLRIVSSNDSRINNAFDKRIVASQIFRNSLRHIKIVDAQAGLGEIAVYIVVEETVTPALTLAGHGTRSTNSERTRCFRVVQITNWKDVI